ncbi:MAG: methionine biosynthesis protein MetW [Burkholderiales bacterium]|nr:methionine biosynthesis protein MetW [Burkholderiales bacterium]
MTGANGSQRPDFAAIAQCIPRAAHVLDLGCGDGTLLKYLQQSRGVTGYGVEIDDGKVLACVDNGVHVIQGDLERGLAEFADGSFDFVVLSQTLQAVRNTERIVREMLRVGRAGIVTFPNFGHWKNRLQILRGRMPVSDKLPFEWFDTPNIHLCTVADFERFCAERGIRIVSRAVLSNGSPVHMLPNLLGELAVYHFSG